jgi:hypothetical protein
MTRGFRLCLALPLLLAFVGCNNSGDLPRVPPPPKEGTVKEGSGSPGVVPADLKAKIGKGNNKKSVSSPGAN